MEKYEGERGEETYERNIASERIIRNDEISSCSYCLNHQFRSSMKRIWGALTIPKANAPERTLFSTIPPVD